ncbi:FtsX-like permease family protein [Catenuloplanes atrovinosus]|uniref:ABC transport system permease protein n=1 Tax=Catenuloplanes atrovinosus TaxID=137266 RepID=A0AAE3YN25_9ACTN|nr:FtsX-like permease family protein [Catenuloplanes atrovinosus]MDR7274821.1 putative ABC transport system permease protein [Catenuloplanes atrovinosus]
MRLLRRVRATAGYLALLGALGLVASLLVSGVPRLSNGFTDDGLRTDVTGLRHQARDLTFRHTPVIEGPVRVSGPEARLDDYQAALPAPLPGTIGARWFAAQVGGGSGAPGDPGLSVVEGRFDTACPPLLALRYQAGIEDRLRITGGRAPASTAGGPVEVMLSEEASLRLGVAVGSEFTVSGTTGVPLRAAVVGVYAPLSATAPEWDDVVLATVSCGPGSTDTTWRAALLTDANGAGYAAAGTGLLRYEWRYRVDESRLTADGLGPLVTAIAEAGRTPPDEDLRLTTALDRAFLDFQDRQRAVAALLAVVLSGMVATLLGLIVLAARLAVDRRRDELSLLRARGGTGGAIGRRTLAETALVVPPAVLAGWAAGTLLPGRAQPGEWWAVLGIGLVATLSVPVLAMTLRAGFLGRRDDLTSRRPSPRRLAIEGFLLLLAVLGVVVLRRRGLSQAVGVDPFLASVPVLLALAAALVAVRAVPWPLRRVGRFASRSRGVVPFLGLARAGRAAPVSLGPLAVLVVAIATGVFTSVVTSTIGYARDRAADSAVAGDAQLIGYAFAPTTTAALDALHGVDAVAPLLVESGVTLQDRLGTGSHPIVQAQQIVVDGPAMARVLRDSGRGVTLPDALTGAARVPADDAPVPAVVSPEVAAEVGETGATEVQGRRYAFRVAAVAESLPGLEMDTRTFIALPAAALPLPRGAAIAPNRFLIAGDGFSTGELTATGDRGQLDYLANALGREVPETRLEQRAAVTTWTAYRDALESGGVNGVLSFTFAAGAAGATLLALLAVGFTVLADAGGRGRTLSRLRTMGLSPGQGRGLLVYELLPLVAVAVLAGGAVGVALPQLLGPALGLGGFTAGAPVRTHVDLVLVLGVPLLMVLALVLALLVESGLNRRMRLGEVLRLGEEN